MSDSKPDALRDALRQIADAHGFSLSLALRRRRGRCVPLFPRFERATL